MDNPVYTMYLKRRLMLQNLNIASRCNVIVPEAFHLTLVKGNRHNEWRHIEQGFI